MNSLHLNDLPREILWKIITHAGHEENICQRKTCLVRSLSFRLVCQEWSQMTPLCLQDVKGQLKISSIFTLPQDLLNEEEERSMEQLQKIDAFIKAALKEMVVPRWLETLFLSKPIICKVQVLTLERAIQEERKQVALRFEGPFKQQWFFGF